MSEVSSASAGIGPLPPSNRYLRLYCESKSASPRPPTPMKPPQLVTIHFDGSVEPRESGSVEEFKGKLYLAEAGDVIYSKIDVRNGAHRTSPG